MTLEHATSLGAASALTRSLEVLIYTSQNTAYLRPKIREKKLMSQKKCQVLSPQQARVRFQPNLPEAYDSPDLNTDKALAYQNPTVIHLDNDEMEITI